MSKKKYAIKRVRLAEFIEQLRSARPAVDRDDALSLMKQVMSQVEDAYDGISDLDRMRVYSFDLGWEDLDKDPCYWDDRASNTHRTFIYNDGSIVIRKLPSLSEIVISKIGCGASLGA